MDPYTITSVQPFGLFDTIILFRAVGRDTSGRFKSVVIAVDHRPARAIREALAHGERPLVHAEEWQVWPAAVGRF